MGSAQIRLTGDATAPGAARDLLAELRMHMDPGSFQRAQVVLSELVTAAVREHRTGVDGAIEVSAHANGAVARFEVSQVCPGFEPGSDQGERPDWGFLALNDMSDAWGVIRGEDNTPARIWFEIYLAPVRAADLTPAG